MSSYLLIKKNVVIFSFKLYPDSIQSMKSKLSNDITQLQTFHQTKS